MKELPKSPTDSQGISLLKKYECIKEMNSNYNRLDFLTVITQNPIGFLALIWIPLFISVLIRTPSRLHPDPEQLIR